MREPIGYLLIAATIIVGFAGALAVWSLMALLSQP